VSQLALSGFLAPKSFLPGCAETLDTPLPFREASRSSTLALVPALEETLERSSFFIFGTRFDPAHISAPEFYTEDMLDKSLLVTTPARISRSQSNFRERCTKMRCKLEAVSYLDELLLSISTSCIFKVATTRGAA
jgi:hypothetical protein